MHYRFIQELLQAMEILPSCFIQSSNYENNFVNTSNDIQTNFKRLLCYCKHRTIMLQDSRVQKGSLNIFVSNQFNVASYTKYDICKYRLKNNSRFVTSNDRIS